MLQKYIANRNHLAKRNYLCDDFIVSSPSKIRGRGSCFQNLNKVGSHEKIAQKQGGLVERGGSKLFHQLSFRKTCFLYYWNNVVFFWLVNIHACCNQQIYSFVWFSFYQKIIYDYIFPLTIIFKYIFMKILSLMTFIYIYIS